MKLKFLIGALLAIVLAIGATAQEAVVPDTGMASDSIAAATAAPPQEVIAKDTPNDAGTSITILWKRSQDDIDGNTGFMGYDILRGTSLDNLEKIAATSGGGDAENLLYKTYLDNNSGGNRAGDNSPTRVIIPTMV